MDWWRTAVFYEIYVRSFQDSDGDGIGDLTGITRRLDYLNDGTPQSLGIDAIWLTPINPSPMRDFGYDVSDYCAVDPVYGTLADLQTLIGEAHRRRIRVILDLVPNHTSDEHGWFKASRATRSAPQREWYVWRDPAADGSPPNNWVGNFGGPAWTFDPHTGQYYLHSFLAAQPDLNYRNPAVDAAMEDVIRFWLDRGIDGFRIDVVHKLLKDAALRDNPPPDDRDPNPVRDYFGQQHLYDQDRPEVHDLLRRWRRIVDSYGDHMMVGEVYLLDPRTVVPYHGATLDELHLAFNFSFLWSPWDAAAFRQRVDEIEALLPAGAQPTYVLSSHDAPRHRSRFDDPMHGEARARVAALMLLTLRGTPFLYYGEEIGMRDGEIPPARVRDPVGKRFAALGRDPERTPMQWDKSAGAGFSSADPWLPLAADFDAVNVGLQTDDAASLLSFYRRVIWYRKTSPALLTGGYRPLESPPGTFVYLREHSSQLLLVALNFSDEQCRIELPGPQRGDAVLSTEAAPAIHADGSFHLGPATGAVVHLNSPAAVVVP
jgi:alpha-glucosidase